MCTHKPVRDGGYTNKLVYMGGYTHQLVHVGAGHDEGFDREVAVHEKIEQKCGLVLLQCGAQHVVQPTVVRLERGHGLGGTAGGLVCFKRCKFEC